MAFYSQLQAMLREPMHSPPTCQNRRSAGPSSSSRTADTSQIESYPLTTLISYDSFFDHAANNLDALFAQKPQREPNADDPMPFTVKRLLAVTAEADTLSNFSTAAVHHVMYALDYLAGQGLFVCQSGNRGKGLTDQTWLYNGRFVLGTVLTTAEVFKADDWKNLQKLIAVGQFPVVPWSKEETVLRQVWGQLTRHNDVRVSSLCTYNKIMFFYRPPAHPTTLVCSRLYSYENAGPSSIRYMFTAVVLAAVSDLLPCPSPTPVVFGKIPEHVFLNTHSVESHSVAGHTHDTSRIVAELHDEASSNQARQLFEERSFITAHCQPYSWIPYAAYLRVPYAFLDEHRDRVRYAQLDTDIPLPTDAKPCDADVVIQSHIRHTKIGSVSVGSIPGAPQVVIKLAEAQEDEHGWQDLFVETINYRMLAAAGLAAHIPRFFGLWQGRDITFLVVGHAGQPLSDWRDLDDAQWAQLCAIVRAVHRAGFHHGDLFPRNVCEDDDGKLRLIDLECVKRCPCKKQCIDIEDLERDSGRSFIVDE
ncbi:hypothetical protein AURDEDRAFT_155252 [Auricularia subglabra TFB-10046 SS5]|nr:hypothetical protein AURDEDRAFT_155252 [Auricularia subglabra TFB-10046 SS5]